MHTHTHRRAEVRIFSALQVEISVGNILDGCARRLMVIVVGNGHGMSLEFKSWTRLIAFSHSTNTLGKGMNPIILPPAMVK